MTPATSPRDAVVADLRDAIDFVERRFTEWRRQDLLGTAQLEVIQERYQKLRGRVKQAADRAGPITLEGLPPLPAKESPAAHSFRYWLYLENQIRLLTDRKVLRLAQSHDLLAEIRERRTALSRKLAPDDVLDVLPVGEELDDEMDPAPVRRRPPPLPQPRRSLLELALDPQSIQLLFALGGALMVVGVVILLWVNDFFTPALLASVLAAGNAAVLLLGWWLIRSTRHQVAGRALTLLACLVMPLNLWYLHANALITIEGQLWLVALLISALYFASALVLRDRLFVYVFCGGLTLAGLLVLASWPPSPQHFWEIAAPSALLVVLGVIGIHLERAFPDEQGPFSRRRFGLAFFWSGHAQLAAGLLLLLGATVAGDWLYQPFFKEVYALIKAIPSPVVGELRWLAITLVALATWSYLYSDIVVRNIGVYVHLAALTLAWLVVLVLQQANVPLGADLLIAVLAATSLMLHVAGALAPRDSAYTRAFPIVGLLLPLLALLVAVVVYLRHVSPDLRGVWQAEAPSWGYLAALVLTAVSCRAGAHLYRRSHPGLSAVYFFATAGATLMAAASLLASLGLAEWQQHGPLLMALPILYVLAARLYRDGPAEHPLVWVGHASTVVLVLAAVSSAAVGFVLVEQASLNLMLAVFFALVAVFYALCATLHRQVLGVHLSALMACAAFWQVFTWAGAVAEVYILTFAVVGLALLVGYRLALVERVGGNPLATAAFGTANVLLSLAFVSAALIGLSRLTLGSAPWRFVGLCGALTVAGLLAVALVREPAWRRWYVVASIGQAALTFLGLSILSLLSPWHKAEVFCVGMGLILLAASHAGWYREQDRESELVSMGLAFGSLLVGVPLALATLIDRSRDQFLWANEAGFLLAALVLTTTGVMFRLKSTAVVGSCLTALYFLTLLIFVPWSRLNTVALLLVGGGGGVFVLALALSVAR